MLAQKLDAQKVASETIATEGNRTFMVAHREGSGLAEWHEKQADVVLISAGHVTMVHGGRSSMPRRRRREKGGAPVTYFVTKVIE